jgi:voltage-gated potassium channel
MKSVVLNPVLLFYNMPKRRTSQAAPDLLPDRGKPLMLRCTTSSVAPPAMAIKPRSQFSAQPTGLLGSPLRNLVLGVSFTFLVMVCATTAYHAAGWSVADAIYMVVVTVYTVGYGEVHPVDSPLLRGITIGTIVLGCTGMIFVTGALVQFITLNQLNQIFGLKRMNTQIDKLNAHIIVCGFGRIGEALATGLRAGGASFVILEQDESAAERARDLGFLCVRADATDEAVLLDAGVTRARTLATVLSNDAANVFITLSARSLNPALEIIARGDLPNTESKLLRAGATKVVLPTHIGAERITEMILYPETARFIRGSERMLDFERVLQSLGLELEVVAAAAGSPIVGHTIEAVEQQANGTFFIVQLNRRDGEAITHPDGNTQIEAGDGLVIVGRGAKARALGNLFTGRAYRHSVR